MLRPAAGWRWQLEFGTGNRYPGSPRRTRRQPELNPSRSPIPRLILPLYLPTFFLSIGEGVLVPTLPLYARDFDVSLTLVTLAIGAVGVGTLLANVPAGFLVARVGGRRVMLAGTGVLAAASLALPFSAFFVQVIAYRIAAGLGTALWSISRFAFIAEAVPLMHRGRTTALFGGMNRAGMFIGPALGGVLANRVGMEAALISAGVAALLAFATAIPFVREGSGAPVVARRGSMIGGLIHVAKSRPNDVAAASVANFLAQLIRAGRTTLLPLVGAFSLGLDVETLGLIIGIGSLIDMVLFLPAGVIMDRFGRKFSSVPSFLTLAGGMVVAAMAFDAPSLLAASILLGIGNGVGSGSMMTLGADLAPPDARGEFLGFWSLIGNAGSTGGPVVVGGLADLWSLQVAGLVVAGLGLAAAVTLAFFVPETLARTPRVASEPAP